MDNYLTESELQNLTPFDNIIDWCYVKDTKVSFQKYKNFVIIWGKDQEFTLIGSKPYYTNMGAVNIDKIPIILDENKIDPDISHVLKSIYKKLNSND